MCILFHTTSYKTRCLAWVSIPVTFATFYSPWHTIHKNDQAIWWILLIPILLNLMQLQFLSLFAYCFTNYLLLLSGEIIPTLNLYLLAISWYNQGVYNLQSTLRTLLGTLNFLSKETALRKFEMYFVNWYDQIIPFCVHSCSFADIFIFKTYTD